jgi:heme-degrading monooxygenase HmoA
MSIKIFIRRKVQGENLTELTFLLKRLRALTLEQPGYVSGETLNRLDKADESMVISIWNSVEDWNSWVNNPKRNEIQTQVDKLLGQDTEYMMYGA